MPLLLMNNNTNVFGLIEREAVLKDAGGPIPGEEIIGSRAPRASSSLIVKKERLACWTSSSL